MSDSPTLAEVLQNAIRAEMLEIHTMLPAKVEKYDPDKQKASVSPLLKKKYVDGEIVQLPVINDIPVQWLSGGDAFIHMPLKVGDIGMVIFAERSLDKWLSGDGSAVVPDDPRHHNLTDAVFIPGISTFTEAFSVSNPDNITIKNNNITIELDPSGKIKIEGATQELLAVLDSFMANVIGANIIIPGGSSAGTYPLDPTTVAALIQNQADLNTLKI
ncbi:hypothetical protein KAR91_15440 [Candidatus Pacearchaeota archaeon]|nr:hypothetical protein [Candidatus Pacearchaeota archaeon]